MSAIPGASTGHKFSDSSEMESAVEDPVVPVESFANGEKKPEARIPWWRKALDNAGNLSDQWKLKQYFGDITNLHSGFWDQISKTVTINCGENCISVIYEDGESSCTPNHLYKKLSLFAFDKWNDEIESIVSKFANNIKILEFPIPICGITKDQLQELTKQFINLQQLKIKIMSESQFGELEELLKKGKYKTVIHITHDHNSILQKIINTNLNEISNLRWIISFFIYSIGYNDVIYLKEIFPLVSSAFGDIGDKVKFELQIIHEDTNLKTLDGLIRLISKKNLSEQIQKLSLDIYLTKKNFKSEEALKARLTKLSPYITHLSIRNGMNHIHWNVISAETNWEKLIKLDIATDTEDFFHSMIYHGPLTFLAQMSALEELKLKANFNMILGGSGSINSSKTLLKEYFNEKTLPKLEKLTFEENDDNYMFVEGNELDLCLKSCLPFTQIEYVHEDDDDDEFVDSFSSNDEEDDGIGM